ncbi:imelysin family protein [Myxococcus sp. SDU36]|uniref:imelysin family protein n=1 Tax=Myxococcus sp. SDU36 TaxID=2831967 RepID=UPI0025434C52|nr:imelysin family protein [Myxococcus sp. SDU36]WIG98845.1 imelysin family protein [Myxococcus sp. SDU36]
MRLPVPTPLLFPLALPAALVASFLVAAPACSGGGGATGAFDRRAVLRSVADQVAVPGYRAFAEAAGPVRDAAAALCAAPGPEALGEVRAKWDAARAAQKRMEVFAFGPVTEQPWRLGPRLDFWPVRTEDVERLLGGTAPLTREAVAGLGAHLTGMPVLEYLLFSPADEAALLAGLGGDAQSTRRCEYLAAVAANVADDADRLWRAWAPEGDDYAGAFARSGESGGAFRDEDVAFSELVNRTVFTVENAREMKLSKPQGRATGSGPRPALVESRFSDRSLQDMIDTLAGIEAVYRGALEETPKAAGLRAGILVRRPDLDARFFEQLAATRAALEAVPPPLRTALSAHPAEVEAAYEAVLALQRFLAIEISQALWVTVAFNDTDGD